MQGVVYKITCICNDKVYIGQTFNFKDRMRRHINALRSNNHCNKFLQTDYNIYGMINFRFEIIDYADNRQDLLKLEKYYIDLYGGVNDFKRNYCMQDYKSHCDIDKQKIGQSNLGKKRSDEFCKQLSATKKTLYLSEEGSKVKHKISNGVKQYFQTPEGQSRRLDISNQMKKTHRINTFKGKQHTQESKDKMSKTHKDAFKCGRRTIWNKCKKGLYHHSEDTKKKIGIKSRKYSDEFIKILQQEFNELLKIYSKTTCYKILSEKYDISIQIASLLARFGTTKHPSYNKSVTTNHEENDVK